MVNKFKIIKTKICYLVIKEKFKIFSFKIFMFSFVFKQSSSSEEDFVLV